MSENGFIKLIRSPKVEELIKHFPNSFILLTFIALRAKRTDEFSALGLKPGESLIGDFKEFGLTRQKYRTALEKLILYRFVTIKTTNKGTIVTLCDSSVFDINFEKINQQNNHQATNEQPTGNHQVTTNKNGKNERMKEITTPPNPQTSVGVDVEIFSCLKDLPIDSEAMSKITQEFAGKEEKVQLAVEIALKHKPLNLAGYIITVARSENAVKHPDRSEWPTVNRKFAEQKLYEYKEKINGKNIFELYSKYCEIGTNGGVYGPPAITYEQSPSAFQEQVINSLRKIGVLQKRIDFENLGKKYSKAT